MKITTSGFHRQFDGKLIKFDFEAFKNVFGLKNNGIEVCASNAPSFNCTQFFNMICKTFLKGPLDITNFLISQMKYALWVLHWVFVKDS